MKTWSRKRGSSAISGARLTAIQSKKREEIGKQRGKASMVIGWFVHADRTSYKTLVAIKRVDSIRKVHYRSRHFILSTRHNKKVKDGKRSEHGYVCFSGWKTQLIPCSLSCEYGKVRDFVYDDTISRT